MAINFSTIYAKKFLLKIALFFFALTFVIRLPFFFRDVITSDETTYILVGQSFLDGYDPGRDFWILRGYPYSLILLLFGKSIVGVRFAGTLCVTVISFFLYLIGKKLWNQRTGILAGIFFIFVSALWPTGQSTRAEIIALVPLIGGLLLLIKNKNKPLILFWAGVLTTMASIVRLNLAYVTLILGLYVLSQTSPKSWANLIKNAAIYSMGSFLIIGLSWLPYALAGQPKLWWTLAILGPLRYSDTGLPMITALKQQIGNILNTFDDPQLLAISILVWLGGLAGFVVIFGQWTSLSKDKKRALLLLILFFSATGLSILRGGVAYSHYLTQLMPFMCLTAAVFFDVLYSSRIKWFAVTTILLTLLMSLKPILGNYKWRLSKLIKDGEINYGVSYQIADYLKPYGDLDNNLYIMSNHYHMVYFLIGSMPMTTSTVHPDNITKEHVLESWTGVKTTTKEELAKILDKNPQFIVKGKLYLKDKIEAKLLLEKTLQNEYKLVKTIEEVEIYRKSSVFLK
jgi:4-amino-4-deoxy-L-arabinose transferase-like glycosyltransferase